MVAPPRNHTETISEVKPSTPIPFVRYATTKKQTVATDRQQMAAPT